MLRAVLTALAVTGCFPDPPRKQAETGADVTKDGSTEASADLDPIDSEGNDSIGETVLAEDADAANCALGGCRIDSRCYDSGERNPDNPCQVCAGHPEWSAGEGACDDGDHCSTGDSCREGECIAGSSRFSDAATNTVIVLGTGGIHPTELAVDRADQLVVAGSLDPDGPIALGSDYAPDVASLDSGQGHVFITGVAARPNWFDVVSGAVGTGERPFEAHLGVSSDSLDAFFAIRARAGEVRFSSATESRTLAIVDDGLMSLVVGGAGDLLDLFDGFSAATMTCEGSPYAMAGSFDTPTMSVRTRTGHLDVTNPGWVDASSRMAFAATVWDQADGLGTVSRIHAFPGLEIAGAVVLPERELATLASVRSEVTVPGGGVAVVLEASTDLQALVWQEGFALKRRFVMMPDSLDAATFLFRPFRVLPEIHARPGGGLMLVAPLREGQVFGDGDTAITIDSTEPGLAIVSFDSLGELKWSRRIRWMDGDDPLLGDGASPLQLMVGDVFVRADGGVLLGGTLTGHIAVDDGDGRVVTIASEGGDRDGWLAGFGPDGALRFAFNAVQGPGRGRVSAIAEQSHGEIVAAGTFEGPTTFGWRGEAGAVTDVSGAGAYVMRLNTGGALDCGGVFDAERAR